MTFEGVAGWALFALALFVPAAVAVAAVIGVLRMVMPALRLPKGTLGMASIAIAFTLWYCIPLVVRAYFGRPDALLP